MHQQQRAAAGTRFRDRQLNVTQIDVPLDHVHESSDDSPRDAEAIRRSPWRALRPNSRRTSDRHPTTWLMRSPPLSRLSTLS
ncbi:MAG: hypothetical protein ACLQFR_05545 [Streptosporangiaceae bacterium]